MVGRSVLGWPIARLVPWLVLLLGLATTATLYASISRTLLKRNQDEFTKESSRLVAGMNAAIRQQVAVLDATAGFVSASNEVRRDEFHRFYTYLARGEAAQIPSVIGVSYRRPWARRGELARLARELGIDNFNFRPLEPRPEAHAIVLVEPPKANAGMPGFDMHSEPVRRRAMDDARDSGKAVLTTRVVLVQDKALPEPSLLLYLPLYGTDLPKEASTAQRQSALSGFVYSGLNTRKLFGSLGLQLEKAKVGIKIWSGEPEPKNLIYDSHGSPSSLPPIRRTVHFSDAVGEAYVEFVALEGFGTQPVIRDFIPPIGAILSVLLFVLATLMRRAHETTERREAEQALLAEVGRLTSGPDVEDRLETVTSLMAKSLGALCRIDIVQPDGCLRTFSTRTSEMTEYVTRLEREFPRLENDAILRRAIKTGITQRAEGFVPVDEAHRKELQNFGLGPVVITPIRAREQFVGAITLTRRKGERPLSDDAVTLIEALAVRVALAIDNARLFQAAQTELVERRAAEAEVRRLNDDLERRVTERTRDLEASNHELESFCYSVSHDLRTPLRSLDGFGRALEEDYGDRLDAQGLDFIERIRAATKRMDELITALLTLSRLTRREIMPTDVDVTTMVRDQFQYLDPEGKVKTEVQADIKTHADPRMLAVVFDNLLSNAIKFSSRSENPTVWVGQTPDGEIFVRDNGAGFEMAYAAKLFQPFERLHSVREFPGHGIGLATVERIVRRHGGEVRAEGSPGDGAAFYIRFPEARAKASGR